ncbi:MAG: acetylornithine deacetylase [Bacteroidota bacterium]
MAVQQVSEILSKLVSFPVFGGESNLSIIHWIRDYIEAMGVETTLVPNSEGNKAALHCRIGPAVDGGFILSGHTDVVPVKGQDWTSDPFVLTDKGDGRLYGRGSCDMKAFIACCLTVLPKMIATKLQKPLYFAFSYDEEIGCIGAPDLIEDIGRTYQEKPKYALIGEPSMMRPTIGQKGIFVADTYVNGSAGHSSRIRREVSAIHEAARLVLWLENKMNQLVDAGHIDERFTPPHSSLHVGKIAGGVIFNIIADHASFQWDVRNIPQDDLDEILAEFYAYCDERVRICRKLFPDFKIEHVPFHPPVPALDTDAEANIVHLMKKLTGNHDLDAVSYAAEAGQFAQAGYESIICGPGSIAQAHRADEFVSKAQLEQGVAMLEALVEELTV